MAGIIPDSPRLNVIVDPTRIKGDRRVFHDVVAASPQGMRYNPADYGLQVVYEPGVGYRCIALDAVEKSWPAQGEDGKFQAQGKITPEAAQGAGEDPDDYEAYLEGLLGH